MNWVLVIFFFGGNTTTPSIINGFKSKKTCMQAADKIKKVPTNSTLETHTVCLEIK